MLKKVEFITGVRWVIFCRRIKGSSSSNTGVPAAGRSCAYGWQLGSLENKGMEMFERKGSSNYYEPKNMIVLRVISLSSYLRIMYGHAPVGCDYCVQCINLCNLS